jgi:hypothetical protein
LFVLWKLPNKIIGSSLAGEMPPVQKKSATMRVIAYGILADNTDEYLRMGEDTMLKCVQVFAKIMVRVFGPKYLQAPNEEVT